MFVTIDSNVLSMPALIAERLPSPAKRWCTKFNRCPELSADTKYNIYYNTPVSMSTDPTYYNMPDDAIHFVYLDFGTNTVTLKRILANAQRLSNVVIISNGDVYATGQYILMIGNCSDQDIADVISGIIVVHLQQKRSVSEPEMIALLCNKPMKSARNNKSNDRNVYHVYDILDAKRSNYEEIENCHECKLTVDETL